MICTKTIVLPLLFSVCNFIPSAWSQNPNNTLNWTANWIWQEADGPENTWMCFRKSFNLNNVPATAIAKIAVDSKYWLYVNDSLVVFEGGLNRGPTPTDGYFDKVDIQSHLIEGENTIAILVWYWGNEGRNNVDSGQGGLLFQADLGDFTVNSDSTWKMKVHPAYGYVPFTPNFEGSLYLYGGWHIGFDARYDMPGWYLRDYDDSLWFNATEKGVPPCAPWNKLWIRPIPLWKDYKLQDYTNQASFPKVSDGNPIIAKIPYNAQITPYFKINAPAGLKLKIQTDHYEVTQFYGHRTEFITKEGMQEFESFAWQNGESVIYEIPAGVEILDLKYRETGYATGFAGKFHCNDNFYNTFFKKAVRTLYVCMRDNYMDCPDRERGQWIGDVATMVPQTFYFMDRQVDQLTLKCIRDFINWRETTVLKGLVPGAHISELASQSLNAISDIGIIMTYYMNTGDLAIIHETYNAVRDYLYVWHIEEGGLVRKRAYWNGQGLYVDHKLIENTWYYMALKAAKKMAELTGNIADIDGFQVRLDTIANNFENNFWKGDAYRSSYFTDDRANGLVVLSGLASEDKMGIIGELLTKVKYARPYMEGYVLEAMFKMGRTDDALSRMKERFALMVKDTTSTTLWETFTPTGSLNHAWSGAPVTSLYRYVAGVQPAEPGYTTYTVLPQTGGLININVSVPSIKGNIDVSINREESQYHISLKSPEGATAIVGVPKNVFGEDGVNAIEASNTIIWKKGFYTGGAAGICWYGEDARYYKFNLEPGTYRITALQAPLSVSATPQPTRYFVTENYPNPFNPATTIKIQIPEPNDTIITIYDTRGRQVTKLVDDFLTDTNYEIQWNGTNSQGKSIASGIYFYQVISGDQKITKKMLLVK